MQKKGNNSAKSQNAADVKELTALKAVVKAVDYHKLESKYDFFDNVKKPLTTLEQRKAQKKRPASSPVADLEPQIQHQQQLNKQPRPSTSTTVSFANHPFPPLPHNHSQMGLADQQQYMGSFGSYGL